MEVGRIRKHEHNFSAGRVHVREHGNQRKKESATLAPPPILKHVDTVWSWVDSTRVSVLSTSPPLSYRSLRYPMKPADFWSVLCDPRLVSISRSHREAACCAALCREEKNPQHVLHVRRNL